MQTIKGYVIIAKGETNTYYCESDNDDWFFHDSIRVAKIYQDKNEALERMEELKLDWMDNLEIRNVELSFDYKEW